MAEIASWNGHSFVVSPTVIRGFTGLTIKGGSETEDKTSGGNKYVSRKNSSPSQVSLTAELNALLGCDVRKEAMKFIDDANAGSKSYFYMAGKKLLPCQLMLTEASVTETAISPNGTWLSCKVQLTMKQCGKYDGSAGGTTSSSSGSSSSSNKASTKTTATVKAATTAVVAGAVTAASAATAAKTAVTSGLAKLQATTNTAKKNSATTKVTSVASKVVAKTIKTAIAKK